MVGLLINFGSNDILNKVTRNYIIHRFENNLSSSDFLTEDDLREIFGKYGSVLRSERVRGKNYALVFWLFVFLFFFQLHKLNCLFFLAFLPSFYCLLFDLILLFLFNYNSLKSFNKFWGWLVIICLGLSMWQIPVTPTSAWLELTIPVIRYMAGYQRDGIDIFLLIIFSKFSY